MIHESYMGAVLILVFGTWLGAFGMFYVKRGSEGFSLMSLHRNRNFILGGLLYVLSIPLYLVVLRVLPVSVAYPMTSMTYIWSTWLAVIYLGEHVSRGRWTGIALLIVGIVLVSI